MYNPKPHGIMNDQESHGTMSRQKLSGTVINIPELHGIIMSNLKLRGINKHEHRKKNNQQTLAKTS